MFAIPLLWVCVLFLFVQDLNKPRKRGFHLNIWEEMPCSSIPHVCSFPKYYLPEKLDNINKEKNMLIQRRDKWLACVLCTQKAHKLWPISEENYLTHQVRKFVCCVQRKQERSGRVRVCEEWAKTQDKGREWENKFVPKSPHFGRKKLGGKRGWGPHYFPLPFSLLPSRGKCSPLPPFPSPFSFLSHFPPKQAGPQTFN